MTLVLAFDWIDLPSLLTIDGYHGKYGDSDTFRYPRRVVMDSDAPPRLSRVDVPSLETMNLPETAFFMDENHTPFMLLSLVFNKHSSHVWNRLYCHLHQALSAIRRGGHNNHHCAWTHANHRENRGWLVHPPRELDSHGLREIGRVYSVSEVREENRSEEGSP